MFELFIALFGGLYYAIRIGGERTTMRKTKEESQRKLDEAAAWQEKYRDNELEKQLQKDMLDMKKWPELRARLLQYREMFPEFCSHVQYPRGDRGWDFVSQDMWFFTLSGKKCEIKKWCLELLMFTYGRCNSGTASSITSDVLYPSCRPHNWPDRLTYDSMKYLYTHTIPSLN